MPLILATANPYAVLLVGFVSGYLAAVCFRRYCCRK